MASSCKADRPSPLKTLFELLALIWMAFWLFGLPVGAFCYCLMYALPKTMDFASKAIERGRPDAILLLPFYFLPGYISAVVYVSPFLDLVVDVAKFLWEAPSLERKLWREEDS